MILSVIINKEQEKEIIVPLKLGKDRDSIWVVCVSEGETGSYGRYRT